MNLLSSMRDPNIPGCYTLNANFHRFRTIQIMHGAMVAMHGVLGGDVAQRLSLPTLRGTDSEVLRSLGIEG